MELIKSFLQEEKNKLYTLSYHNDYFIVTRMNKKTKRISQRFFKEKEKAEKYFKKVIGDKNGMEM